MARALADIDLTLRRARATYAAASTDKGRAATLQRIDDLLDERFAVRPTKLRTHVCGMCYSPATVKRLSTAVPGTTPVDVVDCVSCDRARCKTCGKPVHDKTTRRCPAGHWLDRNQT